MLADANVQKFLTGNTLPTNADIMQYTIAFHQQAKCEEEITVVQRRLFGEKGKTEPVDLRNVISVKNVTTKTYVFRLDKSLELLRTLTHFGGSSEEIEKQSNYVDIEIQSPNPVLTVKFMGAIDSFRCPVQQAHRINLLNHTKILEKFDGKKLEFSDPFCNEDGDIVFYIAGM